MPNIIIGFSRHKSFNLLSWIIQKVERTNFSHVYVKFRADNLNRDVIYQASGLQVNFVGTKVFETKSLIVKEFEIEIEDPVRYEILQFAIDNAGVPYGMKELIGIGITRIARLFGYKIKNPFRDGLYSEICAELVGRILVQYLNVSIEEDLDTIGPKGIYDYVSEFQNS